MEEHREEVLEQSASDYHAPQPLYPSAVVAPGGMKRAALTLGLGVWVIILALLGFYVWYDSDYFHHEGRYPKGWVGYTEHTFIGLVVFTACSAAGVTLSLRGATTLALHLPHPKADRLMLVIGALFAAGGVSGLWWGRESMKCLVIFCLDKSKYVEVPYARPEAGLGFLSIIGMSAFFAFVPIGLVVGLRRFIAALPKMRHPTFATVLGIFLVVAWSVVTFYVPNSWEYFVAARIANNAQLRISTNASECRNYWETTCPEVPWAKMKTGMIFVKQSLILKVYPSNVIFFSYLLLFLLFSRLIASNRGLRLFCQRSGFRPLGLSRGQVFFSLLTASMLALFFYYWVHDHNYNSYWKGGDDRGLSDTERWARSFGQLAVAFLSLLMFPASRFSILHACLGTTWESTMWAHKVLGYGMLLATFLHMIGWYYLYYLNGDFPGDVFSIPPHTDISRDNFTVPLATLATWLLFFTTGVFALWPLRRKMFNVFYLLHLAGFYCIIPTVLWHAAAAWEYLLPGLTVWGLDLLVRLRHSTRRTKIVAVESHGDVTQLDIILSAADVTPGAYVFVNLPEISVLEWHPFTLCPTGAQEGTHSVYIKAMGGGASWTRRATKMFQKANPEVLMVSDGPYGGFERFDDFRTIIFVAGGIGITACYPALLLLGGNSRSAATRLSLIWSARDSELFDHFAQKLRQEIGQDATLRLFYTGLQSPATGTPRDHPGVETRRPNLAEEISALLSAESGRDCLVFACGPTELVVAAERAAESHGAIFHSETFLL